MCCIAVPVYCSLVLFDFTRRLINVYILVFLSASNLKLKHPTLTLACVFFFVFAYTFLNRVYSIEHAFLRVLDVSLHRLNLQLIVQVRFHSEDALVCRFHFVVKFNNQKLSLVIADQLVVMEAEVFQKRVRVV
jgi:hypothetical protein